jgi:hypothetical protein
MKWLRSIVQTPKLEGQTLNLALPSAFSLQPLAFVLAVAFAWGTVVSQAGAAATKTPAKTNVPNAAATAKTPAPAPGIAKPEPVPIPRSVFEVPKTPKDGRDPFFPESARPFGATAGRTNTAAAPTAINLAFKGLAGTAGAQFATISLVGVEGVTASVNLAAGEEGDIVTPTRRIRVRCIEIKGDSVVVETGGVRRELRLRAGF